MVRLFLTREGGAGRPIGESPMPTPEEVKQYGLKVGELIRLYTGGPIYKVSTVNHSRAYCIPLKNKVVKVKTLNPETGAAESREFDRPDDGISIAVMSLVTRVTEEEAQSSADPVNKRPQPKVSEGKVMASASAIPVAGKSTREREKDRRSVQARKREGRAAGIPGGSRTSDRKATPKAPKTVRKCFCGCGEETMSYFVPGHDARFHGWLKQIEKGKAAPEKLLTKAQRDAVGPFKKRGDGFVPSKNYKGEPYKAH